MYPKLLHCISYEASMQAKQVLWFLHYNNSRVSVEDLPRKINQSPPVEIGCCLFLSVDSVIVESLLCNGSSFCNIGFSVLSSFAIILVRKSWLFYFNCVHAVVWPLVFCIPSLLYPFLPVVWVGL